MARAYPIGRTLFLILLGLLGVGLFLEGVWLGWQGESMASLWMILGPGAALTGTAWWLLFHAPLGPDRAASPPSGADSTQAHEVEVLDFVCATNDEVFQRLATETMNITDVIGKRLLNIHGYQQMDIEDQLDDTSVWWLEFEGKLWVTVVQVIAPAFVCPTFQLQFRVFRAGRLDLNEGSPPLVTNPPELHAIQGMLLLRTLPTLGDQLTDKALRLSFGTEGVPTNVLHIGYLDEWQNNRGSGMGARVTPYCNE